MRYCINFDTLYLKKLNKNKNKKLKFDLIIAKDDVIFNKKTS
jgi:hypothetical protein